MWIVDCPAAASVMAGFQLRLQRELFDLNHEQLVSMVQCVGEKKGKRRDIYICLLNEVHQSQFHISIAELKSSNPDRSAELPKKKRSWSIKELIGIDAKYNDLVKEEAQDFSLDFEGKIFTWTSVNTEEKKKFLSTLINLSAR